MDSQGQEVPGRESRHHVDGIFSNDISYILFEPKVVQFFNDDLGDLNGLRSTLYQDIAANVFEDAHEGVFFCTAPATEGFDAPLGEWP